MQRVQDVAVVQVTAGSLLDGVTIDQIGAELDSLVRDHGLCRIVIDLSKVKYMSSAALGVFLRLHAAVSRANGRLVLSSIDPTLMQSFKISKLNKLFEFAKNSASAVKSFKPKNN